MGFLKDMSALGLAALAIFALALTLRAILAARANGYFKAPSDYPITLKQLEKLMDSRIIHKRGTDVMLMRAVLEDLTEGRSREALETFDRMFRVGDR